MSEAKPEISKRLDNVASLHGRGGPPHNGDMDARITKLEALIPTIATREDVLRLEAKMHQELHGLTWKLIGAMLTFGTMLAGAVFFIAKNVH